MRLQRVLAAAGIASRRGAEAWLRAGRVTVNGRVAKLGDSADPARDVVCVDGERLAAEPLEYWMLHKPLGVLTTRSDPEGRPTVLDLLPDDVGRLFPVGRLDRETEGLLLLTNDGPLAHALLHPSRGVEREYVVRVRGTPGPSALRRLAKGIELDDGVTAPARVERIRDDATSTTLRLVITEGRKRQIRRALAALGHPVAELQRVRMGPLVLGRLARGKARRLTLRERAALARLAGLEGSGARTSGAKRPARRRKAGASKGPRKT